MAHRENINRFRAALPNEDISTEIAAKWIDGAAGGDVQIAATLYLDNQAEQKRLAAAANKNNITQRERNAAEKMNIPSGDAYVRHVKSEENKAVERARKMKWKYRQKHLTKKWQKPGSRVGNKLRSWKKKALTKKKNSSVLSKAPAIQQAYNQNQITWEDAIAMLENNALPDNIQAMIKSGAVTSSQGRKMMSGGRRRSRKTRRKKRRKTKKRKRRRRRRK